MRCDRSAAAPALRRVAGNHKRIGVAEDQVALLARIRNDLHSQQIRVEVPGLRVVVDLVGDVVDRTARKPLALSAEAGRGTAAAVATTAILLINWRRVILPCSKSSNSLAMMLSIFILHRGPGAPDIATEPRYRR
jgi:hypothetical protein